MWFLFAIVGLYLATPLLRPIAADEKKCRYFFAAVARVSAAASGAGEAPEDRRIYYDCVG